MKKFLFYLLSFTWGLPMTLCGALVALVLLLAGYKPKKWKYCYYFEVGHNWGGLELGAFFIVNKNSSTYIKNHEHGHAIQNCWFGPLFPFIVAIPSAIRYWWRELLTKCGKTDLPDYDSIWFEGQATRVGTKLVEKIKR